MYFIYVIENLLNGKMYVGQTINLERRMLGHLSSSSTCRYLKRALIKYRPENFEMAVVERCGSREVSNSREMFWIQELGTMVPAGYNLKEGGESAGRPGVEAKRKMSESARNRSRGFDKEWRESMRRAQLGRKHPEEVKRKISDAHKGIGHSEETKEKLRQINLGKSLSEECKKKISEGLRVFNAGKVHFNAGRRHSKETVDKRVETIFAKTSCNKGHLYTKENTYRPPGNPRHRRCRQCANIRAKELRGRRINGRAV